jgi:hypothetical protein
MCLRIQFEDIRNRRQNVKQLKNNKSIVISEHFFGLILLMISFRY